VNRADLEHRRDTTSNPAVKERCAELLRRRQDDATKAKAAAIWKSMNPSERHGVRFGLFPSETMERAEAEGYDDHLISIALMDCAKADGGMIG
jgi:hypothetical protein